MNTQINIENGIYIPSIEAQWLYGANISEKNNYIVKEEFLDKLLKGKLNYSFELHENIALMDAIEIKTTNNGKQYTLDVVNVKYNKKYKTTVDEKTTKELRDWTYENGFIFNGKKLSNWKRSTGKAKEGDNMFVLDDVRDKCLDWSRMNLKFEGNVDIGGIRAYESLPLSSIIGCINNLEPKNILIVDDFKSKFPQLMSKTWLEGKELKTETIEVEESNSIWDGEGLLSSEIFKSNEMINGKGVALLRNRYMKCAGFHTRISEFYEDYCSKHELDFDTFEVEDMYGNKILAKEVQLITTPSAIKLSKYNKEVCKIDGYKGDGAWLQYWKDNCSSSFGICKYEKPSHNCVFDENGNVVMYKNILSYQMVNTIPFTKDELKLLIQPEIQYVEKLKNDLDFFLQEVTKESNVEIKCEDNEECEIQDEFKIGADIDVTSAFVELCNKNSEFQNTRVFKDYRRNYIDAYVNRLRAGKIHINNADYGVVCGNPIELLYKTVKEFYGESLTLKGNELYCSRFKKDGIKVVGFRSPHIMVSNCGVQVNKEYKEITKYMNCTDNIVYFNAIGVPIQSTYSGLDYDIDSILITTEPLITKACSRINNSKFPVPYNGIKNTGDNKKELNAQNMSDVDNIICQNNIGSDINLSQELNSLMNNELYNFNLQDKKDCVKEHNDMINELYNMVSKCNAISNVEIDKSKKQFEELDVPSELRKMKMDMEVVDNVKVKLMNNKIRIMKKELIDKNKEIMKYRSEKRKPYNKRINEINNILRINEIKKLTDEEIKLFKDRISVLKSEIKKLKEEDKDKIKPINKEIRSIEKTLKENQVEKLTDEAVIKLENEIDNIKVEIDLINIERENEIYAFKNEIKLAQKELSSYDKRRIKPYFFKFIGDNESKRQRKKTNAKHRRELDKPIIEKFAEDKGIDTKDVDLKNKELKKLLKVNDKIQKKWEDKVYMVTDTPMDWLQIEVNGIKNKDAGVNTMQVIQLVKKDKHKATDETVNYIVNNIKNLDKKLKAYKMDSELNSKEKYNKMKYAKDEVIGNIRYIKMTRADIFEIMKQCLNSVLKNGKVDKKSGIESLTLELLFKAFGTKLLNMFL